MLKLRILPRLVVAAFALLVPQAPAQAPAQTQPQTEPLTAPLRPTARCRSSELARVPVGWIQCLVVAGHGPSKDA
jgi:hypothetical protein